MTDKKIKDTIQRKPVSKKSNEFIPRADLLDIDGKVVGKLSLPKEIFAAKINPVLTASVVRVYRANQRSGTHATRTRSEVTGSTRKIYRQKGTGRARHGERKAPIFRGGGIIHGPRVRNYSLKFPKKQKRLALFSALTEKFQQGEIIFVKTLDKIIAKTKNMVELLNNLKLTEEKKKKKPKVLLVLPEKKENIYLACRNLKNLSLTYANLLNTYTVLLHNYLVFTKDSIPKLANIFLKDSNYQLLEEEKNSSTKEKQDTKVKGETAASFRPSRVDVPREIQKKTRTLKHKNKRRLEH